MKQLIELEHHEQNIWREAKIDLAEEFKIFIHTFDH